MSSSDEDSNGGAGAAEDLDPTTLEQQRKDVRRERNRQHARVSRERKRQKLEHLQEENDALRRQEAALMDQRDRINARLLRVEYENRALRAWIQNPAGGGAPSPAGFWVQARSARVARRPPRRRGVRERGRDALEVRRRGTRRRLLEKQNKGEPAAGRVCLAVGHDFYLLDRAERRERQPHGVLVRERG